MFKKILIANRGEIALRIMRTCREMGIKTVAVYSTADKDALHVQLANEAICVGDSSASKSYLNMQNILSAATLLGVDAIHPGFGFLSENADFANAVTKCNIKFIGPSAEIINMMGNKAKARDLMIKSGVPVVPGSNGALSSLEEAIKIAKKIGYPVLLKAAAGGGGKGMRKAFSEDELIKSYDICKSEAMTNFSDDTLYLEKLIINPKHIEVQILGDNFGKIVHLGERDCSVQRKNQKMIEETPAKSLSGELKERIFAAAVKAAKACNYFSAGTIEFVLDELDNFYFIEMNTRIQVEHPITEVVTGIDIVKEQIRIACGLPLGYEQSDISFKGHAIECRINAEDPWNNFFPSPGKIDFLHLPNGNGIRIDTAIYNGYMTSPYYDSCILKIITHADTRLNAIKKMRRALEELTISGIKTNAEILYFILFSKEFIAGNYNTGFIEKNYDDLKVTKDMSVECVR